MSKAFRPLLLGIILTVASCLFQALMNATVKKAIVTYPMNQILFLQNMVCLSLISPILWRKKIRFFKTKNLGLLLLRATIGIAGYYFTFFTVHYIPLVDATLLVNAAPLFIPFILYFWKKVAIDPRLWKGLSIGFLGILLILKPGAELFKTEALVGVVSGISYAYVLVCIRLLHDKSEPYLRILFFLFFVGAIMTFPMTSKDWVEPDLTGWGLLIAVGLTTLLTQWLLTKGLAQGHIHVLAPLLYTAVVFAFFIDWLIWGVTPHLLSLVGVVLVMIAGSFAWVKESDEIYKGTKKN